jgi:hypothetical protein
MATMAMKANPTPGSVAWLTASERSALPKEKERAHGARREAEKRRAEGYERRVVAEPQE